MVERAGCVVCPACLRETPAKMSMCLKCKGMLISHGRRKIEIKIEDESGDEDEMEVDENAEAEKENSGQQEYQEAVDAGKQAADHDDVFGYSEEEVDYGADEEDAEMESKDETEEGETADDEQETQDDDVVKKSAEYEAKLKKFPKWTHPLEIGVKTMPITNLTNVDPDEGAARIFDNLVLIYILGFMEQYTRVRVHDDPEAYYRQMTEGEKGRIDLDGLCPYNPNSDALVPPTPAQIRPFWETRAKPDYKCHDIVSWASPEERDMPIVIDVASKMEKVMAFLVEAGYTYTKLLDFKPSAEDKMDRTRRVRMQLVIRNFLQRAFKGAFPKMETYSYFRGSDDHGETCLSIPAMGLILATRQDKRPMETSICATQSGVTLNESLRLRMEYSFSYANKRAEKGDKSGLARLMPSMTPTEREREAAHYAAGEMSQYAIDQATADYERHHASASSSRTKATPSSRPSTEAEPKAKKKPRKQDG